MPWDMDKLRISEYELIVSLGNEEKREREAAERKAKSG